MKRSPSARVYVAPVVVYLILSYFLFHSVWQSLLLYALPALLVICSDEIFVHYANFYFPSRRIYFLNFSTFTVFSILAWITFTVKLPIGGAYGAILFSWSAVSFLRVILYYPYYSGEPKKLYLPSMFPIIISAVLSIFIGASYVYLLPSLISGTLFYLFGIAFVQVSIRDFQKEFGVSPITVLNMFLNLRTEEEHEGLEFFKMIYSNEREVPVKVVSVVKENGSILRMVFPYVHPGPFGKFGSSNLPEKLSSYVANRKEDLMVFHTTTTNSNNCRDEQDVVAIAEAVKESINKSVELPGISRFRKLSVSGVSLGIQRFGDVPFVSFIPDREKFDDASFEESLVLSDALIRSGTKDVILVDSQSYFFHGAPILSELHRFQKAILREYNRLEINQDIIAGYGKTELTSPGVGPMGIQALVIGNGKSLHCYMLSDSNNITPELIGSIKEKVPQQVTSIEFYTTDNHVVNSSTLDMNPLGERDDLSLVREKALDSIELALKDIGKAKIFYGASTAKVHMGEEGIFKRLNSTVFQALHTAKYAILATSVSSLLLSGLVFFILSKFA